MNKNSSVKERITKVIKTFPIGHVFTIRDIMPLLGYKAYSISVGQKLRFIDGIEKIGRISKNGIVLTYWRRIA